MKARRDGNAIVYCEGAFATTHGKTAHGLVRRTRRYTVVAVVDSTQAGKDAGELLGGRKEGIPIVSSIPQAVDRAAAQGKPATHVVIGLAPDGGRLSDTARRDLMEAIRLGLNVDSGLHDFLGDDDPMATLAAEHGVTLRDVRKPPPRHLLHNFTGKISEVACFKVAVLGTDSAVGKRTTAWILVDGLEPMGLRAQFIGTGQTAWMQGARYGIILDSVVNDFLAGELEHVVWTAWNERHPDVIVIEGQGSLMNPAYPGGYEILAATRPDAVILQHAPARKEYDGFPGHPLHPLAVQIQAIELISGKPVIAVTLNHEHLRPSERIASAVQISKEVGLPVFDVLADGGDGLCRELVRQVEAHRQGRRAATPRAAAV